MKNELLIYDRLDDWAKENERIGALLKSEYGAVLRQAYRSLDTSVLYRSRIHGVGHVERTVLLGAMISHALGLSMHESKMLLLCCSYHDIGRHNDFYDTEHGNVAAKKLMSPEMKRKFIGYSAEDFRIMQAAITLHSRKDADIENVARLYSIPEGCMERFYRVAKCLKDSDNLDRVRIGDLDTKHLRHPESVAMVPDAQWIFDQYKKSK